MEWCYSCSSPPMNHDMLFTFIPLWIKLCYSRSSRPVNRVMLFTSSPSMNVNNATTYTIRIFHPWMNATHIHISLVSSSQPRMYIIQTYIKAKYTIPITQSMHISNNIFIYYIWHIAILISPNLFIYSISHMVILKWI